MKIRLILFTTLSQCEDTQMESTYMTAANTYTPANVLQEKPNGVRLDYILFQTGKGVEVG
jgi:hypothetical protein